MYIVEFTSYVPQFQFPVNGGEQVNNAQLCHDYIRAASVHPVLGLMQHVSQSLYHLSNLISSSWSSLTSPLVTVLGPFAPEDVGCKCCI